MANTFATPAHSNLTEAEAISRAKNGDSAAFELLYHRHCPHVYSVCLRMIKNPAEAEDLTQKLSYKSFEGSKLFAANLVFQRGCTE